MKRAMHDPKFEKAVQEKMHDLEFVPSESVWENIRREVAPRQRRRGLAAIWWWLVPGMVLLGTGVALYRHSTSVSVAATGVSGAKLPEGAPADGSPAASSEGGSAVGAEVGGGRSADGVAGTERNAGGTVKRERNAGGLVIADRSAEGTAGTEKSADGTEGTEKSLDGTAEAAGALSGRAAYKGYRPGLISFVLASTGVHAPRLYPKPVNTVVSGLPMPKHPWMAGFAGGAGVSSVHATSAGKPAANATYTLLPISSPNTFSTYGAGAAKRYASDIKPDLSYWAGVFAEKPLSARWSVDLGLNLHYYSIKLHGQQVSNYYASPSASLITSSSITYTSSGNAGSGNEGEQSYTNRYYYLELPVAVQWKVNQNPMLPIFWRAGVVVSYLMASDALYYDDLSGSFYRDNAVARNVQASVASGLMVGLPVRGVRIQAGPEVQYGLTSMLSTASGNSHLFYGGMRVALMR
jgi:hypothetical protein